MPERVPGLQLNGVERAFQRLEVLPISASTVAKEYFLSRALQLQDLAHIQQHRPLARPGKRGWRFTASPHVEAHLGKKAFLAWKRLQDS